MDHLSIKQMNHQPWLPGADPNKELRSPSPRLHGQDALWRPADVGGLADPCGQHLGYWVWTVAGGCGNQTNITDCVGAAYGLCWCGADQGSGQDQHVAVHSVVLLPQAQRCAAEPPEREEFTKHLGKGILIGVDFLLGVPGFSSWFWYTWGYSCIAFEVSMFPNFQGWCSRWERRPWCEGPIFNQATGWPSVWECRPWCWPNITNEWPFLWECRPWCWPNINKDTKGWPFLWECRPWCWPNINKDTKGWPFLWECRPRCWPCQFGTWRRVTFSTAASSLENQEHRKPKGDATIQNLRFDHILHNLVLDPTKDGSSSYFFFCGTMSWHCQIYWDTIWTVPISNQTHWYLNLRWLKKSKMVHCVYLPETCESDYMWRRIQVSQQQAERQKKSLLQLCMMFHRRAAEVQRDWGFQFDSYVFKIVSHDPATLFRK